METTAELKGRFQTAFRRYSAQTTKLLKMRATPADPSGAVDIHGINEQWRNLCTAELDYRTARLKYAQRLLSRIKTG